MIPEFLSWYAATIEPFFIAYGETGRQFLNVVHIFFSMGFNVLLVLAILVSVMFYIIIIYERFSKKPTQVYPFKKETAPFVTIQLPTRNELAALDCAKRCLAFDYPKDKYEIFIGDDSDEADVSKQLRTFAEKHEQVTVWDRPDNREFKAGNLNNMLPHSKGEIIVIFDSDFLPGEDFLKRIVAPFQHIPDLTVAQARWKINNSNTNMVTVLGSTVMKVFHYITMPFIQRYGKTGLLCGSAEAIKKEHIVEAGGWSGRCLIEDIEASMRLHSKKRKFVYLDDLECECEVPYTPKDLYKQQKRWAYGVVKSVFTHGGMFVSSKPGWKRFISVAVFASGYFLSALFMGLFVFGVFAFLTHEPAPMNLPLFFTELGRNVLLTSGLLVASVVAIFKDKDIRRVDKVVVASFTYGILVMIWVNVGLYQVATGKDLGWHVPKKVKH